MLAQSKHRIGAIALTLIVAVLTTPRAHADSQELCQQRLFVDLTPDVPNPRDPGFLSSLLNNHPAYFLEWVHQDDPTEIVLDLSGPGSPEDCSAVVAAMRKDGRVESIHVGSEEDLPAVSVESTTTPEERAPSLQISHAGLGSLFWAARNPTNAWRILAPLQPDDPTGARESRHVASVADEGSSDMNIAYP